MEKTVSYVSTLVLILLIIIPTAVFAEDTDFDFDIYLEKDSLKIWSDYTGMLNNGEIESLQDGTDILIECHIDLVSPRRFFGERKINGIVNNIRINYRLHTDTYSLKLNSATTISFADSTTLFSYMQDSIVACLGHFKQYDVETNYALRIKGIVLTLTDLNIASPSSEDSLSSESPVRFLFRQFLSLTGYGRRDFETSSISFFLNDL